MPYFDWVFSVWGARFGLTHDLIFENDSPYLERWIIWFGYTIRLHRFHKGDDDRAFHDHPWWFVTVPFRSYEERTPNGHFSIVRRFKPHFRSAKHRHIVRLIHPAPVWTLIITGRKCQEWGFWKDNRFVHHSLWQEQEGS